MSLFFIWDLVSGILHLMDYMVSFASPIFYFLCGMIFLIWFFRISVSPVKMHCSKERNIFVFFA